MDFLETAIRNCKNQFDLNQDPGFFINLEYIHDSSIWIQVTNFALNMYYPFVGNLPNVNLEELGIKLTNNMKILEWNDGVYLTIDVSASTEQEQKEFLSNYISKGLKLNVELESWISSLSY